MRMKNMKCLSLCLALVGICSCLASCGERETCCEQQAYMLDVVVWNEDKTEEIHRVVPTDEVNTYDEVVLELGKTYVFEVYINHEDEDPDYNYTDVDICYDDIYLEYDSTLFKFEQVNTDKKQEYATKQYYYVTGKCESEPTITRISISDITSKVGGLLKFFTDFHLSFQ